MSKNITKKNKKGRPSKYNNDNCTAINKRVYELALLGLTDKEMAKVLAISTSTFYKWQKEHFDFSESIKAGKKKADAKVALALYKCATGYPSIEVNLSGFDLSGYSGEISSKSSIEEVLEFGRKQGATATISFKQVSPNATAAMKWLANRSDSWSLNPDKKEEEDLLATVPIHYEIDVGNGDYIRYDENGNEVKQNNNAPK